MLIKVKVFPCAKEEEIIRKSQDSFEVRIREKPQMGQANKGVVRVLAGYFKVPEGKVRIVKGFREPGKIVEVKNSVK
jgi:hypothetical protein